MRSVPSCTNHLPIASAGLSDMEPGSANLVLQHLSLHLLHRPKPHMQLLTHKLDAHQPGGRLYGLRSKAHPSATCLAHLSCECGMACSCHGCPATAPDTLRMRVPTAGGGAGAADVPVAANGAPRRRHSASHFPRLYRRPALVPMLHPCRRRWQMFQSRLTACPDGDILHPTLHNDIRKPTLVPMLHPCRRRWGRRCRCSSRG